MGYLLAAIFILLEIVAIVFAWRAIKRSRTPQGAIGWVVFLIAAPYLGVPLYLFLGHHRYQGFILSRRASERVVEGIRAHGEANVPATETMMPTEVFERISEFPAVGGNSMRLLIDGDETFGEVFRAMDAASDYILVQSYIVNDDGVGRRLKEHMVAAARRGVKVRFLVDAVGCIKLPASYFTDLAEAGVEFVNPKEAPGAKTRFHLNFRNHRKTIIIDGKTGFTGGLNFGDEYRSLDPKFGNWRDTHACLEGPLVAQLQLVFAEDWHWATGEVLIDELFWEPEKAEDDMTALLMATGPADDMETGALFFFSCIAQAKERVWIASPYFVPDTDILTALKFAAVRGVDVRILVPEMIDHTVPWLAAFAYFDEIRAAGASVWRYDDGFMHQKVVLVDDTLAAVGTTNMDNRSFRLNFEAMAMFFDPRAASATKQMLETDFARSFRLEKRLSDQPRKIRLGAPVSRLLSPLL